MEKEGMLDGEINLFCNRPSLEPLETLERGINVFKALEQTLPGHGFLYIVYRTSKQMSLAWVSLKKLLYPSQPVALSTMHSAHVNLTLNVKRGKQIGVWYNFADKTYI